MPIIVPRKDLIRFQRLTGTLHSIISHQSSATSHHSLIQPHKIRFIYYLLVVFKADPGPGFKSPAFVVEIFSWKIHAPEFNRAEYQAFVSNPHSTSER